ncbi:hypothetical protein L6278_02315 [Candidatus Parcubacteria bacterium]|nr:hypothetical protein [Candidatus Parcubacteria bacterium]
MGQFLPIKKSLEKNLPKSLLPLKKSGFLKASFSVKEIKQMLKKIGGTVINGRFKKADF